MNFYKIILLVFILLLSITINAQNINVTSAQQITNKNEGVFFYPKFTPDGKKIFFSGANFIGLYYYDLVHGLLKKLNNSYGGGYGFSFSPDSKRIYYREDKFKNTKKISSIVYQEISTKKITYLVKNRIDLSVPIVTSEGDCFYTESGKVHILSPLNKKLSNTQIKRLEPIVFIENENLMIFLNGEKKILDPMGSGSYLWPSLSPDKKKILFTFAGDASYVCDLNGKILLNLGWANAPRLSPDGKWIAFMDDRSDGFNFKSSDIMVMSADGKNKFELTPENEIIKLYPEWSSLGNKIVYHSLDGIIYLLQLHFSE
jgi:Tol biopolymer transport system component